MQLSIKIAPDDFILNDIMSSVKGTDQRKDFIKEAIYGWDYILHHTNKTSYNIDLKTEEILFPPLDIDDSNVKQFNKFIHKGKIERKPISVRFSIAQDDVLLQEIIGRVSGRTEFIKEAIYNWYYAIHNSYLTSRFVDVMPGYKKNNYFILNVDKFMQEEQLMELYSKQSDEQTFMLANLMLQSLNTSGSLHKYQPPVFNKDVNNEETVLNDVKTQVTVIEDNEKSDEYNNVSESQHGPYDNNEHNNDIDNEYTEDIEYIQNDEDIENDEDVDNDIMNYLNEDEDEDEYEDEDGGLVTDRGMF